MRSELEASGLKRLLNDWVEEIPTAVVKLSFSNGDGFALRVHPVGQSVSYLYYHNGREWHALREDGVTPAAEMGWSPAETEMVAISIIFLAGQLAGDYMFVRNLPYMEETAGEKEDTFLHCLTRLQALAEKKGLGRQTRKWAAEAANALNSMS